MPALSTRQADILRQFRAVQNTDRQFKERNPYYTGEFMEGWRKPADMPHTVGGANPTKAECSALSKKGWLRRDDNHFGKGTWFQLTASGRAALLHEEQRTSYGLKLPSLNGNKG